MIFKPRNKDKWIAGNFPDFTFDGCKLEYVSQFRYLGHIINDNLMMMTTSEEKLRIFLCVLTC